MQPCCCCLWAKVARHCKHKQDTWSKLLKDATSFYSYTPWQQCVNVACLFMVPWQQPAAGFPPCSCVLTGSRCRWYWRASLPSLRCSSALGNPGRPWSLLKRCSRWSRLSPSSRSSSCRTGLWYIKATSNENQAAECSTSTNDARDPCREGRMKAERPFLMARWK